MTRLLFAALGSAFAITAGSPSSPAEERPAIYPFDVSVAGQEAVFSADFPTFAKVLKPVAPDAEVALKSEAERIIVNVFPCAPSGEVADGATPKIIMVDSGTSFKLDATLDKSALKPGLYGMNISLASKGTARVMFTVEDKDAPASPAAGAAPDQSSPEKTLEAVFAAAKTGDLASLKTLVPASGDLDGDVRRIRDVAGAEEAAQKEFQEWFATGKITGAARIEAEKAEVDFTFGPDGNRKETMNLVLAGGKWYLDSF